MIIFTENLRSKQTAYILSKQIPSSSEDISIIFFRTSTQNEAGKVIRLMRALATRAAIQYRLKKKRKNSEKHSQEI